jgi:hypothetical protein
MNQILKAKQTLNKAFLKLKPNRLDIDKFKQNLIKLIDTINDRESEEFHKNLLIEFLKKTYYDPNHFINTKGRNDLVIHNGQHANATVGVIIEAKKPNNKAEMPSQEDLNKKALQELVLYYLRERITHNNLEVKHLVITNISEWFIFDATIFDRLFAQNKNLVKQFQDFEGGRLADNKTDFFYTQIAKPFIANIHAELTCAYVNIKDYEKPLRNADTKDDYKLIALFKLLSPQHLLKLPFANDSNTLDKGFYHELLHIIGLTETKEGSKKLIERNKTGERNIGTILESAIIQLESLDKLSRLQKRSQFGANSEEQCFHVALELSITWINRILFLKLLEAQLLTYHKGDTAYSFLSMAKITNYDDLNALFFQVLAHKPADRNTDVQKDFALVPYLNSSLFEPTELEHHTLFISNLKDDKTIPIFAQTVLKDQQGKKRTGNISTLEYLFAFLNAYDFGAEGTESIQEDNKRLINASVLGLIFEKINGYKDGSFYTPGFITSYMCKETIHKAVLQKFNEAKKWDCASIEELYNKIEDKEEANQIINSIKICDPAVGSGHFLVSALNEILALKHELKILQDKDGKRLKEYQLQVVNDELVVLDENGELFVYQPKNVESRRVQETLFHEKQTIIESCLFGVDINPNSVKICRLRLWIELLKNAYYKNATELETLPNIDINIKCGNSLVSRFAIDADLKQALKKSKWTIDSYRLAVQTYRNAKNKEEKWAMEKLIADIKSDFRSEISQNDPKVKKLGKNGRELFQMTQQTQLFEMSKKEKALWNKKFQQLTDENKKLETEIEAIKANKIFENAFEWRFEFPEVLNEEGDFVGFDVVIGNPPYGVSIKDKTEREYLVTNIAKVPDYEIYYWFINKGYYILKQKGVISYIIPNTILFNVFAQSYRLSLFDYWCLNELLDCTNFNIFEDATVRNIIFQFTKDDSKHNTISYKNTLGVENFENLITRKKLTISKEMAESNIQNWGLLFKLDKDTLVIVEKIKNKKVPLIDLFPETSQGLIAYDQYQGQSTEIIRSRAYHHFTNAENRFKCWLYGEDVKRYSVSWNGKEYIDYCDGIANPRDPKFFKGKRLLIREITNPSIFSAITTEELYNDPAIIVVKENPSSFALECLLAILNSKLATFYHFNSSPKATKGVFPKILVYDVNNFPLPETIDNKTQEKLETLVNQILAQKSANPNADTSDLETQIDQLVYQLYDLTEEEIKIIENK